MSPRLVRYANVMARGTYVLTAPSGRALHESLRDCLTPSQMLHRGVFGGRYLNSCTHEYPAAWFRGVRLADRADPTLNRHGVLSGQSLAAWRRKGWIREHDPRGWFEWWCRYYRGRRIPGYDEMQIARRASFLPRHMAQTRKNPTPRRLQALLQWGVDTDALT